MKPILFNTDMARGLQNGTKTATRRVVKPQPRYSLARMPLGPHKGEWHEYNESSLKDPTITSPWGYQYTSPCYPGDILYVRETWTKLLGHYLYKADQKPGMKNAGKWHPSIHMPREAARIFLRVTDVRVERLQDITEEQAQAEGAIDNRYLIHSPDNEYGTLHSAREHFAGIWDSTIKPADRALYGWEANPWVWIIEFERCEKPEEEC